MTLLLAIVAAAVATMMIGSTIGILAKVTPMDATSRGPWGIATWRPRPDTRPHAHQRRWQTALRAARRQPARWPDLIAEIERLESVVGLQRTSPAPRRFDPGWVEGRIAELEATLDAHGLDPSAHGAT